jgi:hypothetical protein
VVLNYYGPLKADVTLPSGTQVILTEDTKYPKEGKIRLEVGVEKQTEFILKLRIPSWSKQTRVVVNGHLIDSVTPGTYLELRRKWKPKDQIEIELDMSLRTWIGDLAALGKVSLYRGTLLLTFDQVDNPYDCADLTPLDFQKLEYKLKPATGKFPPLVLCEFTAQDGKPVILRDYATAGARGTEYLSWLPVVNAPPPAAQLISPASGEQIPKGPWKYTWSGMDFPPGIQFVFEISNNQDMNAPLHTSQPLDRPWYILREPLEEGKTYFWRAVTKSSGGEQPSQGAPRTVVVNATLPNHFIDHPATLAYRTDSLVAGSYLNGTGSPVYGYEEMIGQVAAAADRHGQDSGAVTFDGHSMLRYRIPTFPVRDYTFLAWVCVDDFPPSHLGQIFSAWAKGGDDPLRIVAESSKIFARIEGLGSHGTSGVEAKPGVWFHVAAVKKGATLQLFIDGIKAQECPVPNEILGSSAIDFALGGNPHHSGDEFLHGKIDDFAFYAKALDAEEIMKIFKDGLKLD